MPVASLRRGLQRLTLSAHARGTKAVYDTAMGSYARFCNYVRKGGASLPRAEKFLLFIVFLAQVCKLAFGTIKVYAAGVRSRMLRSGMSDPAYRHGRPCYQLKLLMRGIQRNSAARAQRVRKPLTKYKLLRVLQAIPSMAIPQLDQLRFRAAVLLAFWGFFRSASFCSNSGSRSILRRCDISFKSPPAGKDYVVAHLRKSKTKQFEHTRVYIYANAMSALCPFKALQEYFVATRGIRLLNQGNSLFFLPGKALTLPVFNCLLKTSVRLGGLNPALYSSHSLRAGAATTAANSGVPPYLIKKLGRWKSETYNTYIRHPKHGIRKAQGML